MATTLNASNSGSGGLVQTADASGILALRLQAVWDARQTQPTTDEIIAALVARIAALESRT
jgi:hypothetical protein